MAATKQVRLLACSAALLSKYHGESERARAPLRAPSVERAGARRTRRPRPAGLQVTLIDSRRRRPRTTRSSATNKPWDLDECGARALPSARGAILRLNLASLKLADDVDVATPSRRARAIRSLPRPPLMSGRTPVARGPGRSRSR